MSHWDNSGIDWDAEVHERIIQDGIEKQARMQSWTDKNKGEVERLLNEALVHLHGDYDIDEIIGSLGSAIFLLEDDAGEHAGPGDGTPFGG